MENVKEYILKEGVLNDDLLRVLDDGFEFKGGYIATITEYRYKNEWSNEGRLRQFRSKKSLLKYIAKNYPEFDTDIIEL